MIKLTKETFSWGILRKIATPNYSVIIHPEHWEKIKSIIEYGCTRFKDEQGYKWNVYSDGLAIRFFTMSGKGVKINYSQINELA